MTHLVRPSVAVVVLTYNEEANLPHALSSVAGWADELILVDSGSTDATVEIARQHGCKVFVVPFENYGAQRSAAIGLARDFADWMLFLDADESVPQELKNEIDVILKSACHVNGYFVRFRMMWSGKWIRHGYYPTWILRLVRANKARCEDRSVNERLQVDGATGRLTNDLIHEDHKGIGEWVSKHNRYAVREALEAFETERRLLQARGRLLGTPPERSRWLRVEIWDRLPPIARSFVYFGYRYIVRGGFLDGVAGLTFHFMHGLWYPMLIDLQYLELKRSARRQPSALVESSSAVRVIDNPPRIP